MEEATMTNVTTGTDEQKHLVTAYTELCNSYHAIDDFRTKLLGFLPLVTGGGLVLLSGRAEDIRKEFFGPVGRFGVLVTLGLLAYELFGIKKCHALIQAGQALERRMDLPADELGKLPGKPAGQFIRRPNNLLWFVNEPFAAAMIYPAVLAAWTYLAVLYDNPSRTEDSSSAQRLSLYIFIGGFALILLYDGFLRITDWLERRRSSGVAYDQAKSSNQPTQTVSE
jgi:hypothetical protein